MRCVGADQRPLHLVRGHVEVAPQYDGPGQLTALHGARLIIDTVGAAFRRRAELR